MGITARAEPTSGSPGVGCKNGRLCATPSQTCSRREPLITSKIKDEKGGMLMSVVLSPSEIAQIQKRYSYLVNYEADDPAARIDPMTYRSSDGDSLLHVAAQNGDEQTAELLLRAGFDPNVLGDMGSTPLHYAKAQQRAEVVALLLAYGARDNIRNEFAKLP
jgi:hypothetical protein